MEDFNDNMNYDYNQQNNEFYTNPHNQFYDIKKDDKPIWAAMTSFILSIVNIVFCCCCSYISVIASLVLGIVSLAKKWRGKGFAIAGVVISSISFVILLVSQIYLGDLSAGLIKMIGKSDEYYEEYSETGEVPDELDMCSDEKYDWYWSVMGYESFDEFFDFYMKQYGTLATEAEQGSSNTPIEDDDFFNYDDFYGNDENSDAEFGETPVDL